MSGSGIRVFASGEILTAAQVNGYLMDQAVTRFADAATRDASFGGAGQPVLTEGRICYLDDVNLIQFFDGAAWQSSAQFTVADGSITSAKIENLTIVDGDISASAAISLSKLATGALPTSITVTSTNISNLSIINDDISASASIVDTKLATISTALKVSNSATTADSANTASAIVARDGSGNFAAGMGTLTSASVSGRFDGTSIREAVIDSSVSASVVTADYSTGDIFYVGTAPASNFTVKVQLATYRMPSRLLVLLKQSNGQTEQHQLQLLRLGKLIFFHLHLYAEALHGRFLAVQT